MEASENILAPNFFQFTVWVVKYTINYGPIRETASMFTKILMVIKYTLNYAPICDSVSIFRWSPEAGWLG